MRCQGCGSVLTYIGGDEYECDNCGIQYNSCGWITGSFYEHYGSENAGY